MKLFTKWDKIVIGVLLLISVLPVFIILPHRPSNNKEVVISVQGKIVKEFQLERMNKSQIYNFKFNGNTGYVETNNGRVRMLEMSKTICPNAICSNTGWISESYQSIVCLPNKIVVTIKDSNNNNHNNIDIISG